MIIVFIGYMNGMGFEKESNREIINQLWQIGLYPNKNPAINGFDSELKIFIYFLERPKIMLNSSYFLFNYFHFLNGP
tara:strand:- start:1131 stop:1361 length:231 start_codon:yes stop_codon:yes gene_type:complete